MLDTRTDFWRLLSTSIGSGVQRGSTGALILVMVAATSRYYGIEAAGTIGLATTVSLICVGIADFGLNSLSLREFAREAPSRQDYRALTRIRLWFSLVVSGSVVSITAFAMDHDRFLAVLIALGAVPITHLISVRTATSVAQDAGRPLAISALVGFLAGLVALVGLVALHSPSWLIALALPTGRAAESFLLSWQVHPARTHDSGRFNLHKVLLNWPLALQGVLQIAYQRSTIVVSAFVLTGTGLGYVSQGFAIFSGLALLPSFVATAAFPRIARAGRGGRKEALSSFIRYARTLLIGTIPLTFLLMAVPQVLTKALYGTYSPELVGFMRWAAIGLVLSAPNSLITALFVTVERQRVLAAVSVLTAATSVALVFFGARISGVAGVGFSLAASELVTSMCFTIAWLVSERRFESKEQSGTSVLIPAGVTAEVKSDESL